VRKHAKSRLIWWDISPPQRGQNRGAEAVAGAEGYVGIARRAFD